MEDLYFDTFGDQTLYDIVMCGARKVAGNNLKGLSHLEISPKGQSMKNPYTPITLSVGAYSSSFQKGKIGNIDISTHQTAADNKGHSQEVVLNTLRQFGGNHYFSMGMEAPPEKGFSLKPRYSITTSTIAYPFFRASNAVEFPGEMNSRDVDRLTELLDILGVRFKREERFSSLGYETLTFGFLRVKPHQWKRQAKIESQAKAYEWALENGFYPHIYSSRHYKHASISEWASSGGTRGRTLSIKKESDYIFKGGSALDEAAVLEMQTFVENNLGVKFGGRVWEISYYSPEKSKEEVSPKGTDKNTVRIVA